MKSRSHFANVHNSDRLQKVLASLQVGGIRSTANIQSETGSVAVHTDISELRSNGYDIGCKYLGKNLSGRKVFGYELISSPAVLEAA